MPEDNVAQVPDAPEESTTPTDSPTDTTATDTEPSQGGEHTPDVNDNVPFHKHPRWIEKQREIDSLKKSLEMFQSLPVDRLKTLPNDFEQIRAQLTPKPEPEMPEWWKEAFGTDDASKAAYLKQVEHEQSLYTNWEQRVLEKLKSEQETQAQREKEEVERWQTFIDGEVDKLVSQGKVFDKNELLKIVDEFSKDAEGNYLGTVFPFDKAYEILQMRKSNPTPTAAARTNAARQSVSHSRGGIGRNPSAPSIEEVRNRGWGAWRK